MNLLLSQVNRLRETVMKMSASDHLEMDELIEV